MITDTETNFVYFSSLIKSKPEYSNFWQDFEQKLIETKPFCIENTEVSIKKV